jgi:hypothetical protein
VWEPDGIPPKPVQVVYPHSHVWDEYTDPHWYGYGTADWRPGVQLGAMSIWAYDSYMGDYIRTGSQTALDNALALFPEITAMGYDR